MVSLELRINCLGISNWPGHCVVVLGMMLFRDTSLNTIQPIPGCNVNDWIYATPLGNLTKCLGVGWDKEQYPLLLYYHGKFQSL